MWLDVIRCDGEVRTDGSLVVLKSSRSEVSDIRGVLVFRNTD